MDKVALVAALNAISQPSEGGAPDDAAGSGVALPRATLGPLQRLQRFLASQSEFPDVPEACLDTGLGKMAIIPSNLSGPLLDKALRDGAESAAAWLDRVLLGETASGHWIMTLAGISVAEPVELLPGFELLPLSMVADTPAKALAIQLARGDRPGPIPGGSPPAAARLHVPSFPWRVPLKPDASAASAYASFSRLQRLVEALTMFGGCPRFQRGWFELSDPDQSAAAALPGCVGSGANDLTSTVELDVSAAKAVLPQYEKLSGDSRVLVDLALERLNLARRRSFVGDRALDGAIALEALLGDAHAEEVTYRLRLRAALLLGASLPERREISTLIKKFYAIRSSVAHGRVSARDAGDPKNPAVVESALDICGNALRRICELGKIPNWQDVELEGGVPGGEGDSKDGTAPQV